MTAALRARCRAGASLFCAISPFDVAERLGIEVRFQSLPTLEGMAAEVGGRRVIIVTSLRPPGRQAFTAAHELGHHLLGHGVHLDELMESATLDRPPEEYAADLFAATLLMSKSAVAHGFSVRGWDSRTAGPEAYFTVSGWLGVGYETLVRHVQLTLGELPKSAADALLRSRPADIRRRLCGADCGSSLYLVDEHWTGRPVDVQIGDWIRVPAVAEVDARCIEPVLRCGAVSYLEARSPGLGRIENGDWAVFVRASRAEYAGMNCYRHLEESADGE